MIGARAAVQCIDSGSVAENNEWLDDDPWTFVNSAAPDRRDLPPPPNAYAHLPPPPVLPTTRDWVVQILVLFFCGLIGLIVLITNKRFTRSQKWYLFFAIVAAQCVVGFIGSTLTGSDGSQY